MVNIESTSSESEQERIPTIEEVAQMNLDISIQFARGDYESRGENEAKLCVSTRQYTFDSPQDPDDEMRKILDRTYKLAHAQTDQVEDVIHSSGNGTVFVTKRIPTDVGIVFDEVTMYGGKPVPEKFINFSVFVRRPEKRISLHR